MERRKTHPRKEETPDRGLKANRWMLVRNVTLAHRHTIHRHFANTMVVHEGSNKNEHVEDLV